MAEAVATLEMVADKNQGSTQGVGTRKFLTFFLGAEEYGIEILKVREIIGMMPITPVPRTPEFIRGVINLRGKVIPVVDLRLKFGMPAVEQTEETCVIVVQADDVEMGTIVDKVSEVADIDSVNIEEAPFFGDEVQTDYILGLGKSADRVTLLLDIDKALETDRVILIPKIETEKLTA
ncbi:MAG: purine-binding chemotaxis protein CheW [Candidatus Latescibacterota bacterium]|jgi:purine-binding chemotaxis protein CheW